MNLRRLAAIVRLVIGFVLVTCGTFILLVVTFDHVTVGSNRRLLFAFVDRQFHLDRDYGDRFENGTLPEVQQTGRGFAFRRLRVSMICVYRPHQTVFVWIPHWVIELLSANGVLLGLVLLNRKHAESARPMSVITKGAADV